MKWQEEFDLCYDHIISNNGKHDCIVGKKGGLFDNCTSNLSDIKNFIEKILNTKKKDKHNFVEVREDYMTQNEDIKTKIIVYCKTCGKVTFKETLI